MPRQFNKRYQTITTTDTQSEQAIELSGSDRALAEVSPALVLVVDGRLPSPRSSAVRLAPAPGGLSISTPAGSFI